MPEQSAPGALFRSFQSPPLSANCGISGFSSRSSSRRCSTNPDNVTQQPHQSGRDRNGLARPGQHRRFLTLSDCQVVAACDIDANHLQAAVKKINDTYGNEDCKGYHDFRELLARDDIDAVMIAVPDHWHEIVATEAARRKKDIYGEKPLAHTIEEQQSIVRAVQQNQIIWQMGSWQRSVPMFHKAAEIVRNGLIGEVTRVEVGLPGGNARFRWLWEGGISKARLRRAKPWPARTSRIRHAPAWNALVTDPPKELDYEMWIGPSKMEPYIRARSTRTGAGITTPAAAN